MYSAEIEDWVGDLEQKKYKKSKKYADGKKLAKKYKRNKK